MTMVGQPFIVRNEELFLEELNEAAAMMLFAYNNYQTHHEAVAAVVGQSGPQVKAEHLYAMWSVIDEINTRIYAHA